MSTTLLKIINRIRESSNLDMSHIEDYFKELQNDNILYEKINKIINENDRDLDCSYRDLYLLYKSIY
jgi:hypothetical protein